MTPMKEDKIGTLVDRLSILELREFMAPRFRGHKVEDDDVKEIKDLRERLEDATEGKVGEVIEIRKLNARVWMLQHARSEIHKKYIGRPGSEEAALTAIGMLCEIIEEAMDLRSRKVATLNGEAMRKVY